MNGHTPGPWKVHSASSRVGKNFALLAKKTYGWVNVLHGNDRHGPDTRATTEEAEANARLIAAAPDLLSVCQRIANINVFSVDNDVEQIVMQARTVFEMATGEKA